MAILARLLDGVNAADIGVLLALVWLVVRLEWTRSENAIAHAAITRNIDGVKQELSGNINGVKQELSGNIDGVKQELTRNIDGVKQELTRNIDGVKQELTRNIDGVKQELTRNIDSLIKDIDEVKQDVKMLLTGDVAWMQAVLRDRERHVRPSPDPPSGSVRQESAP